jgi:hypothetical protein
MNKIPLTKKQKEIMKEFYNTPFKKILLSKDERNDLWHKFKNDKASDINIVKICPAVFAEMEKALVNDQNLQSAVFSECVYAQTLANILDLKLFVNHAYEPTFLPSQTINLMKSYNLNPRYVYSNTQKTRMLIQAGGCAGIDSALISVLDNDVYTIEFKEAGAKTTEPDLPKYGEDGKLIISETFQNNYPQFIEMLKQHIGFNFFENMGHNENKFTPESIRIAVTENYSSKKFADVICTEDVNDYLTMLPANQVDLWATLKGEIRTAGRNPYRVWTPKALLKFIKELGGKVDNFQICVDRKMLKERKPRGGKGVTGYKITSLFFVRIENTIITDNDEIVFNINDVWQLNPTVAAKIFFRSLSIARVHEYYRNYF